MESLVLSHLSYCVTIWGSSLGSTLLQRLQRMQNHAVRLCCSLRRYDHVSQVKLVATALLYSVQIIVYNVQTVPSIQMYSTGTIYCFDRTSSYCTRTPVYFANVPVSRLCFPRRFFVLKPHSGGTHCHPL